ncbi:MAG TPA: serine/threonine-protein kinase [Planctomycetota bacterium]
MAEPQSSPAQAQGAPKQVGGYELLSKLGQGGMGAVFKARQISLDRIVALKVLPPRIAKDAAFIERFQREARASAKLNHPNIVQGIDVGKDPATGLWYFAMEFVDGPSLQQVLKNQKVIPEKRALEIARDIARALECASQHGIVHRDIKPDNVLLTQRGEAKLADLGLAKQMSEDSSVTQSGQSVGTPHYMAPEQARGAAAEIDTRTDLYALGGTLFHLVTGRPPFLGDTSAIIMTKHLTEVPPKANRINPDVSEACARLIARLMQKKREQRVQSPATVIQQIEEILNPSEAAGGTAGQASSGPRRTRQDTTGPRAPVSHSEQNRTTSLGLGAAALLALVAIGYFALRGKPAATKSAAEAASNGPVASVKEARKTPLPVARNPAREKPANEGSGSRVQGSGAASDALTAKSQEPIAKSLETVAKETPAGTEAGATAARETTAKETPTGTEAGATAAKEADATAAIEAKASKAQELFAPVLKDLAPLLAQNKYSDAHSLLDQKLGSSALADARDLLKQEKADVQAIQDLRKQVIEALRKMPGKTVSLKKGSSVFSGKVKLDSKADAVGLQVANGLELTLSAEQLHVQDVDNYAENATPEDLRRHGLLFLAAGDKESVVKAKQYFTRAKDGGLAGMERYLDRIAVIELGEVEVAAEKAWAKAEATFTEKRYKDAEDAYTSYQQKFAKTKNLARNADTLAARMKAILKTYKPEITFRADESMKMFPSGQKFGEFPVQEGRDPLAPFENKAAYFMQKSGTDVVYDVSSSRPLKQIRWKGAAMQNMTIEILDTKGAVLTTGGPYQGGNRWAEFTVNFEPRKDFVLRFRNHVSVWYLIAEIELK